MADEPEVQRRTVAGVELVTIPLWHYVDLLQRAGGVGVAALNVESWKHSRFAIDRDEEVRQFFIDNLDEKSVTVLVAESRLKFGKKRTPSVASIYRWRQYVFRERRRLTSGIMAEMDALLRGF